MTKRNDGGPAFPSNDVVGIALGQEPIYGHKPGMTLRDWFAGQALAGMLARGKAKNIAYYEEFSGHAYAFADAMIAERGRSDAV